jgi:hypothetical protein
MESGLLEKCGISDAEDGTCEDLCVLGCDTLLFDRKVPAFWGNTAFLTGTKMCLLL